MPNNRSPPEILQEMLNTLVWRNENSTEQEFITALTTLREQINQMDDELLTLLAQPAFSGPPKMLKLNAFPCAA